MASATARNSQATASGESFAAVPARAVVILVAGMAAAWFAAGSTGLLGHPLRHTLTWIALAVAIVAAWPVEIRTFRIWAVLAVGVILGFSFTTSPLPAVNVLAVAVVLAAIAQVSRGVTARVVLLGALAATVLGCFRFACVSIPIVRHAADGAGCALGRLAGWLAGSRLEVGATFGGIDFLVLTAVVYAGWMICTPPPRRTRAIWAAAAIIVGQLAYLIVPANSEKLLALLPETIAPIEEGTNHVGLWTLSNGLRTLIPWNLPLLAMAIQGAIVAVMVGSTRWLPVVELDPRELKKQQEKEKKEDIPGSVLAMDMLFRFGPALLAVAAALFATLAVNGSDLGGKTIVAHQRGYMLDWLKPRYDSDAEGDYGMLPVLVESLGGKFVKSKDLSEQDLAEADVLLLIHADRPWPRETLQRIWDYVRRGGSLLLAADPAVRVGESSSSFNDVLKPLAMRVRFDTAVARAGNWEQSYEAASHPATVGLNDSRNPFGMQTGSSLDAGWLARPVLTGRWGWSEPGSDAAASGISSYNAGERLGDLTLAAEQPFGRGRVVVLGGTAPLHNEMLASSYPFVGRLLGYLADRQSSPWVLWRQLCALAVLAAMVVLLACRLEAWQMILTPSVLAVALIWSTAAGYWSARVLPDGRRRSLNNVAYVDASHLESYSSDTWADHGVAGLLRALMRHGYLPLMAPDLKADRLERCGLLISIGPARSFSPAERDALSGFVGDGGTLICLVGAEQARPSAPLLKDFGLRVPYSPVPPGDDAREPEPFGGGISGRTYNGDIIGPFHAAWPVESTGDGTEKLVYWTEGENEWALVLRRSKGRGSFVVIGDTHNAGNANNAFDEQSSIRFWRWLLSRVVAGQAPWEPPAGDNKAEDGVSRQEEESAEESGD
ncbi:MAG: hypothetical protein L6306_12595 [Planctomycetales bacterium]|nr:hypothetical protein [Planctomycetales bacterium]